jgi:hypothetical protein
MDAFVDYIRMIDRSGKKFLSTLRNYAESRKKKVQVEQIVTNVSVTKVTPVTRIIQKTESSDKFDEIWDRWPRNYAFPETEQLARTAFNTAVFTYGEDFVVEQARKYIRSAKELDAPKHFKNWVTKDLPIWAEQNQKKVVPKSTPEEDAKLMEQYYAWLDSL